MIAEIKKLVEYDVAGDPMSGVKWTRCKTEKISQKLALLGIHVCPRTVARILKDLDYRLRTNHKRVSRGSGPERNEQFEYIAGQRTRFAAQNLPIVSHDVKKKEMVGNFKNPGTAWRREPELVNDHDFRSDALGIAIPSGIYDVLANRGTVFVGISHATPDFAVDTIVGWWEGEGRKRYEGARELLLLADSGGSSSPRNRAFKYGLQTRLADRHGLSVTVCHYPSGASKWNPIEHRLFSEITKNWAGIPLRNYETILKLIRGTETETGLRVSASLIAREYPKGVRISDADFATINLQPHETQPLRNYTIHPRC